MANQNLEKVVPEKAKIIDTRPYYDSCESVCGQKKACGNVHCSIHPKSVVPKRFRKRRPNNNHKKNYVRKPAE